MSGAQHVQQQAPAALLLVDVINHFEFPGWERLLRHAERMAPRLAHLKQRVREAGLPVIYVNDNFGRWRSDRTQLLDYCLRPEAPGRGFVECLRPEPDDYFVLKPMHSAFYQSPLEALLNQLGARTLMLGGIATNSCVLSTAFDAAMREFEIWVPGDCSAAENIRYHRRAMDQLRTMNRVHVEDSRRLAVGAAGVRLARSAGARRKPISSS